MIFAAVPWPCHAPVPEMEKASCGEPVRVITVPPVPDPLPRRTTPEVVMFSVCATENAPAARSTAPRSPPVSGSLETASMAPWMAAVSSAPLGFTVIATGTSGIATPPPSYPA